MAVSIEAKNLTKEFIVTKKEPGLKGAFKNLIHSEKSVFRAVNNINFSIDEGQVVGYIGPNGAGKSTTIKMMSGILQPTSGDVTIRGISPFQDRKKVVRNLGVVFGQRTQLYWDLRLGESFELLRRIYEIDDATYQKNLRILNDILNIQEIINTPVRQLSLGQRMRGDLAAAILHSPPVIFLDEPTIGLDVDVKYCVRQFIKDINDQYHTTIILTTHDLGDIEELCRRIIIINHGEIVHDCSLETLMNEFAPNRQLIVDLYQAPEQPIELRNARVIKQEGARICLEYNKKETSTGDVIEAIAANHSIQDISIEESNIEDVIRTIYARDSESA
jgi:ABC-2 type transport system ATP-binding protein